LANGTETAVAGLQIAAAVADVAPTPIQVAMMTVRMVMPNNKRFIFILDTPWFCLI
jgi:hypothetical protein